jgi:hypothetical protein
VTGLPGTTVQAFKRACCTHLRVESRPPARDEVSSETQKKCAGRWKHQQPGANRPQHCQLKTMFDGGRYVCAIFQIPTLIRISSVMLASLRVEALRPYGRE